MAPSLTAALAKHGCDMPYIKVDEAARDSVTWDVCKYLDRRFKISSRGSTLWTEVRGGCVGWMTMSYIMIVHPAILHVAAGGNGIGLAPLVTTTALSAAFGSLFVGLSTNTPFGLMPGMGLNAYFSYGVCKALGVSYQKALSCSFVGGAVLLFLCTVGACDRIVRCLLSEHLKKAITAAIGLFQAMNGFQVMGLVVYSPDTLVTMVDLTTMQGNAQLYLALAGLLLISALLVGARMPGAMLVGVLLVAACSWLTGLSPAPAAFFAAPSFEAVFQVDFSGWWPGSPELPGLAMGAAVMLFVCLFDIAGVSHGLQSAAGIPTAEQHSSSIIGAAASATVVGSLLGTSPVIVANESSAAIIEGARTGLSALVMSVLFLLSAVIAPVLCAVPRVATAVPLVIVGAFMMAPCRYIHWDDLRVALPSFLTMTVVPFTYSIHGGIVAGIVVDHFLSLVTLGHGKEESVVNDHGHSNSSGQALVEIYYGDAVTAETDTKQTTVDAQVDDAQNEGSGGDDENSTDSENHYEDLAGEAEGSAELIVTMMDALSHMRCNATAEGICATRRLEKYLSVERNRHVRLVFLLDSQEHEQGGSTEHSSSGHSAKNEG